jgi:hypothetical protein
MDIEIYENKIKLCIGMVIKDIGSFTFYAVLFGTPSFPLKNK